MKTVKVDTAKYVVLAGQASFHTAGAEFASLVVGDEVKLAETQNGTLTGDSMVRKVTVQSGGDIPIVGFTK